MDTAVKPADKHKCTVADNRALVRRALDTVAADTLDKRTRAGHRLPDNRVVENTGGCKTLLLLLIIGGGTLNFEEALLKFCENSFWLLWGWFCFVAVVMKFCGQVSRWTFFIYAEKSKILAYTGSSI